MAGERYTEQISSFNSNYNLNYDIKGEFEIHTKFGAVEDFTLVSSPQRKIQKAYLKTLNNAIKAYLEEKTKMQADKKYDLSDVSIKGFVSEFDKVINAILTDAAPEDKPYEHTPFAGASESFMAANAWNAVKQFNKPLHEIWADQIRKGTLTLDDLQTYTRGSADMLDRMIDNKMQYTDAAKKNLATVVMAKKTMEEAINKRSWTSWLNPLNWGPNRRENARLEELNAKLASYRTAGFPVDDVVPQEYGSNMLGKALAELQKAYGAKKTAQTATATAKQEKNVKAEKKKPEPNKKKQPAKKNDVVGKVPTQEVAEELMKDQDALSEQIFNVIGDYGDKFMRNLSKNSVLYSVRNRINNAWNDFKNADTEDEKKEAVQDIAMKTFKTFYNTVVANISTYSNSAVDQIVMTQKLTDFVLNNFSPIASNSKYAEYGNNYYVKNATPKEFLDNALKGARYYGKNDEDAKKDLDNAKFELGVGKMSVNTNKDFKEKPTQKTNKISNLDDPKKTISKNK